MVFTPPYLTLTTIWSCCCLGKGMFSFSTTSISPIFWIPIAWMVAGKDILVDAVDDRWRESKATRADAANGPVCRVASRRVVEVQMVVFLNMLCTSYISIGLPSAFVGQRMCDTRKGYELSHDRTLRSSARQSTSLADVITFALSQERAREVIVIELDGVEGQ